MGRVRRMIQVDGRTAWTLFDTGSRNTYVTAAAAAGLPAYEPLVPRKAALGGKVHTIQRGCILKARIEGKPIEGEASIVDEIGKDEDGRPIEILFGALLMQKWGIRVHPDTESVDLSNYPEEFVEYTGD